MGPLSQSKAQATHQKAHTHLGKDRQRMRLDCSLASVRLTTSLTRHVLDDRLCSSSSLSGRHWSKHRSSRPASCRSRAVLWVKCADHRFGTPSARRAAQGHALAPLFGCFLLEMPCMQIQAVCVGFVDSFHHYHHQLFPFRDLLPSSPRIIPAHS